MDSAHISSLPSYCYEDDTSKWKDTLCSWIRKINTVKMLIQNKAIYPMNKISIKMQVSIFTKIEKNPKICREPQNALNSQSHFEQEE